MEGKRKLNFLLYGEGSFLNKGCEAIVNTTIKKIKKICDGEIILSTNDLNDSNYYNNIITKYVKGYYSEEELSEEENKQLEYYKTIPFDYTNFEKIYTKDCIKEIDNVDICMSVGGDNYCYGEPNWMYTVNKEIKRKNKKNVFWCTSLFENIESDEMIRDLKTYDIIIARETLTYKALNKFINKENLILAPDTAFSLESKEVDLPNIFKENKNVIGINISPLISKYTDKKNNILSSVKALIDYILKETDHNIALIPHVYLKGNNDLDSLKDIKNLYQDENRIYVLDERIYNCEELKYIISKCSYLVAARTHASIAGYSSLIPTLVIGYSVKSKGIALDLFGDHENYVIPVDKMTPEMLVGKFKFIQENEHKIKQTLQEKVPVLKEQSDNLMNEILERLDYFEKKYVTSKSKCTGCMACLNICPNDAIKVIESNDGFLYTEIDKEKCIGCGACKNVCPANRIYQYKYENPEFYAVMNLDDNDRLKSSSGGVVALLARKTLEKNGVVYGATLEEKEVKHIRIDDEKDLYKIMGSKYVQSKIDNIYKVVKEDLENKKQVLFTGTPCQIEGLKSYLNKDYENLTCISIICHGVPSPKVFKQYIEQKEDNRKQKIKGINFRNKNLGWHKYSMVYQLENGDEKILPFTEDDYMKGFLGNYYLRESCYNCQMRFKKKNSADIIIGDFWGIENIFPEMDDDKGISAVIINSAKGAKKFQEIKEKINYQKTTFEDIFRYNPVLTTSVKYTKNKNKFFKLIENNEIATSIQVLKGEENEDLRQEINRLNKEIATLNSQIKDLLDAKQYFLGQIEMKEIQLKEANQEKENVNSELYKIYNSRRWKYTSKIANTINKIKRKKD